ncbi:hypothetical protein C8F04DRAFT_1183983 [Mycena alexandri]|uniref:Uncharacterized protein n=1 Tax=Mycena alexandri TaxID=1745969 RepID=A0AAD6SXF0_9AGAR|nr:hypothetical protein C8F04DRAFT_1183983 [Mycena alexandri]
MGGRKPEEEALTFRVLNFVGGSEGKKFVKAVKLTALVPIALHTVELMPTPPHNGMNPARNLIQCSYSLQSSQIQCILAINPGFMTGAARRTCGEQRLCRPASLETVQYGNPEHHAF